MIKKSKGVVLAQVEIVNFEVKGVYFKEICS